MGLVDFSLDGVGGLLTSAREAITGKKIVDPEEIAKIERDLQTLEHSLLTGQMEINRVEAAHPSRFIAGWRPFTGWVCAAALAYVSIIEPIARFIATVCFEYTSEFPVIDTTITMQVLLGMLGFGGLRSLDKYTGKDTRKISSHHD